MAEWQASDDEPTAEADDAGRVVVGVDGSAPSLRALEWAGREATHLGAVLDIWVLWMPPVPLGTMAPIGAGDYVMAAKLMADEAAEYARERWPDLVVESHVTEASPAPALVEASRDASLLVVGSRGVGGFRGLLLGSVSHYCAQHAHCPVMVVRQRSDRDSP
jgi:nucleotide-binding universal stress UspA family protein